MSLRTKRYFRSSDLLLTRIDFYPFDQWLVMLTAIRSTRLSLISFLRSTIIPPILFRLEHLDVQWKVILEIGEPDEKSILIVLC